MADKNINFIGLVCRKSLFFLFAIATLLFFLSWFFLLDTADVNHFDTENSNSNPNPNPNPNPDPKPDPDTEVEVEKLSTTIQEPEPDIREPKPKPEPKLNPEPNTKTCDPKNAILKVFMYDLPPEFHFGLLEWKPEQGNSVWPDITQKIPSYPGGLNLQHSIEYWLTLDLLSSTLADRPGPCTAVRVLDSRQADVVFVPFFSSLSYNRHSKPKPPQKVGLNKILQDKLVKYLVRQKEWKRSGGRDHVILAHHPNSMLDSRMKLWPCMFILSDFGRYPPHVANVEKDIIAPYRHMIRNYVNDSSDFDSRKTLLYFQGAIYRKDGGFIRQELFYMLKNEKDVHFAFGSIRQNGVTQASQGMHSSKFCLNIAGDTPSSNRLFDAIASHCVPVIISDGIELPYEDVLDYSEFSIFVRTSDASKKGYLLKLIRGISREEWTRMWKRLKEVEGLFEYRYPSQKDDAVQMIWQAVARKVPLVRLKLHKFRRFDRFEPNPKSNHISQFEFSHY